MKTFPIFIRESNNHMNDLRLFSRSSCRSLHLHCGPPIVTLECWMMELARTKQQKTKTKQVKNRAGKVLNLMHASCVHILETNLQFDVCSYYAVINILRWHLFVID